MERRRSHPPHRPSAVALGVTLGLIALSLVIALSWRARLQADGREQFDVDATRAEQLVVERLQSAIATVQDTRAAVDGDRPVTAGSFEQTVAAALPDQLPSLATVTLVERVPERELAAFESLHRAAGLPGFRVRSVEPGGAPPAVATFEASTRGAPILSGYDVRSTPAMAQALAAGGGVRMTSRLSPLPRRVLQVHPDLGESGFALVAPVDAGSWVLAVLSGDELARQAASLDGELDVTFALGDQALGSSTADAQGTAIDLSRAPSDARTSWDLALAGGPLSVTVADLDGLSGGGWREPALLFGAGIALSILVGSLILVLARGRAGALLVASEAQDAMARSEQHFRAVVQHLSDLVVVIDEDFGIGFVAPSVTRLLGRDASVVASQSLLELAHRDDRRLLASLAARPGLSEKALIRFRHSDGSYRSFEVVIANRLDEPAIGGLVVTGHDVTDRVLLEDRLSHEATHDSLTQLPNRALLLDRLDHALALADRSKGRVGLVFVDLDDFKIVNDVHGHHIGDELLVAIGHRLHHASRAMDTVGRYAGDEFLVICEDLESESAAVQVAQRLYHEAARPVDTAAARIDARMSVGVALAEPGETAQALIARADAAMYDAKGDKGSGTIVVAPPPEPPAPEERRAS